MTSFAGSRCRSRFLLSTSPTSNSHVAPPARLGPRTALIISHVLKFEMPPSAMAMPAHGMHGVPSMSGRVDPAFWGQGHDFSDSTSPISPSLGVHLSPTTSTTDSFSGNTPPLQTPPSEANGKHSQNSQNGTKNAQKDANSAQARASVAVACVPCRSRHLKCDGGVRCSRCRADGVDCTYIKSRRGWKGKRKNKDESGGPVTVNGA